jgi:hypothetical protein
MPPSGLEKVVAALSRWKVSGYVNFDSKCSQSLPEFLPGYTEILFKKLLYEYILKSGDLRERRQNPDDGWDAEFFYFSTPSMEGKQLYVKMILEDESEDDLEQTCTLIVSLHPPTFKPRTGEL